MIVFIFLTMVSTIENKDVHIFDVIFIIGDLVFIFLSNT
jgi:hypothetical protein